MKNLKNQGILASFPWKSYSDILDNQRKTLDVISKSGESLILELPTGSGKTAIGYTFLKSLQEAGKGPLFYTTPTKTLVDQVKALHPDVRVIYGRNEYQCLYYKEKFVTAEESPCSMLNCPHRVDLETGVTAVSGVKACPYLSAKFLAGQGGIVVCTTAFYLFYQLFAGKREVPAGLVVDEAHQIARVVRGSLSYEITDYHLKKGYEFLEEFGLKEAPIIKNLYKKTVRIVKGKSSRSATLLDDYEVRDLLEELNKISPSDFEKSIREAARVASLFSKEEQREILKRMEMLGRDLVRYYRSLEYSLPTGLREPLNFTYGYWKDETGARERVNYRIFIKAYHVAGIVRKILSPQTVAYSATIGDPEVFGFETGIKAPFFQLASDFPTENTRIFLPTDTPNLAIKARSHREPTKTLRKIAKACFEFSQKGIRSLVVVVSEKERNKFLELAKEEGVKAVSYGNGVPPRIAAAKFKDGEGDVLVGTVSNFGEGIDLPKQIAPVIFFLRPGYPNPKDPTTVFEERRFRGMRWKLWNWRVMIEALQVRGRNVRSTEDIGITIFVSQQFRRFLLATLPEWLEDAYRGNMKWEDCLKETFEVLGK